MYRVQSEVFGVKRGIIRTEKGISGVALERLGRAGTGQSGGNATPEVPPGILYALARVVVLNTSWAWGWGQGHK